MMPGDALLSVAWHGSDSVQAHMARNNDTVLGMAINGDLGPLHTLTCAHGDLPVATVHAPLLGSPDGIGAQLFEIWHGVAPLRSGVHRGVSYRHNGDLLFGSVSIAEHDLPSDLQAHFDAVSGAAGVASTRLAAASFAAYSALFDTLAALGFDYLLRVWNYIPDIVDHMDGSERYWQFNSGRQAAFSAAGRTVTGEVPAACALGLIGGSVTVFFIATRIVPIAIENPRQVSAFNYPRQYGPKSPTFARAVCIELEQAPYLFISGTASIVGHQTMHVGDVVLQTHETLDNLRAVIAAANQRYSLEDESPRFALAALNFRVYIRRSQDFDAVRAELIAALGKPAALPPIVYLRSDVCRPDLLVEIEAAGGYPMEVSG
jgi:chorismate lyase / 3-hydroxybenzoate synthase